jgi:hypothetical protein
MKRLTEANQKLPPLPDGLRYAETQFLQRRPIWRDSVCRGQPPGGGTISFRAAPSCICMNPMPRVARDSKPVQKNSGRLTGPSAESRPVPGGNVLVSRSDDGAHYV